MQRRRRIKFPLLFNFNFAHPKDFILTDEEYLIVDLNCIIRVGVSVGRTSIGTFDFYCNWAVEETCWKSIIDIDKLSETGKGSLRTGYIRQAFYLYIQESMYDIRIHSEPLSDVSAVP